ncbi:MAG: aldolase, partial [Nanoarchaeota archaeon]|nr:aldolase [Nanoarchaeota archaeon]
DIAIKGKFNGIILQKGIAEKYYQGKIPLILKLNGKTKFLKGDPLSTQLCTVKEAIDLGAKVVGYTIYVGSCHEQKMFQEFEKIQREAHKNKLPVIAWMYPRGKAIKHETSKKNLAYAARIGLELGADIIKTRYSGTINSFEWVIKSAGKVQVLVAGGSKKTSKNVLQEVFEVMQAGAKGMAIGRNIWQHEYPLKMTKAVKDIIFNNKTVQDAIKRLK